VLDPEPVLPVEVSVQGPEPSVEPSLVLPLVLAEPAVVDPSPLGDEVPVLDPESPAVDPLPVLVLDDGLAVAGRSSPQPRPTTSSKGHARRRQTTARV